MTFDLSQPHERPALERRVLGAREQSADLTSGAALAETPPDPASREAA